MKDTKTIEQAVQDEIDAFIKNSCEFSAHTITTNIRTKVNNGQMEIDGLSYEMVNGVNTQKIDHNVIRSIVHQICARNVSGYDRKWNQLPNGGGYFSWAPVNMVNFIAMDDDEDDEDDAVGTTGNVSVQFGTLSHKNPVADPNDPIIQDMVVSYVLKHRPVTLRDIQKRMKRNRLTIAQIEDIVEKKGFSLKGICVPHYAMQVV